MNRSILTGRTTTDITLRYTSGENAIAFTRFNLAVDRRGSKNKETDFITCQAWGKTAELMERYVHKGDKIGVAGRIQTGSYEKDGHKVYTTDVVVEELEFLEKKKDGEQTASNKNVEPSVPDGFYQITDDDVPF